MASEEKKYNATEFIRDGSIPAHYSNYVTVSGSPNDITLLFSLATIGKGIIAEDGEILRNREVRDITIMTISHTQAKDLIINLAPHVYAYEKNRGPLDPPVDIAPLMKAITDAAESIEARAK